MDVMIGCVSLWRLTALGPSRGSTHRLWGPNAVVSSGTDSLPGCWWLSWLLPEVHGWHFPSGNGLITLCVQAACFPLADTREGEEVKMVQSSPCQVQ